MNEYPSDLEFALQRAKELRCKAPERAAAFAIAIADGQPGYVAAEKAGYSAGHAVDEETRRKNLSAAAARARKADKIQRLVTEILARRQTGSGDILSNAEVLQIVSSEARNGSGQGKIAALRLLANFYTKNKPQGVGFSMLEVVKECLRRDSLLFHVVGIEYWLKFRDSSPDFARWHPPPESTRLINLIQRSDGALSVLELLDAARSVPDETDEAVRHDAY